MTDTNSNTIDSAAAREAIGMFRPGTQYQYQDGYADLLGDNPGERVRRDQSVFRSRMLPRIYERMWRPFISRLFFGKGLGEAEERQIVLEMLQISAGDRVLDVGCGTGNYARHLAVAAGSGTVVGLDASKPMIATAARRGGPDNLTYLRGDACDLPFDDGRFQTVCSVGVIHMIGEPMKALTEMVRVLVPGGRLVVVASHEEDAIRPAKGKVTTFGHDELTGALESEGLTDIQQRVVRRAQFVSGRKPG